MTIRDSEEHKDNGPPTPLIAPPAPTDRAEEEESDDGELGLELDSITTTVR